MAIVSTGAVVTTDVPERSSQAYRQNLSVTLKTVTYEKKSNRTPDDLSDGDGSSLYKYQQQKKYGNHESNFRVG